MWIVFAETLNNTFLHSSREPLLTTGNVFTLREYDFWDQGTIAYWPIGRGGNWASTT